ncbi:MAG: hypothetical protein L3J56_05430 [Bacteroidales bacterium]|nr:hypothetical protein [Bacteroidales bacterium]
MKKQKLLLVLLLGMFVVFQSCEKKSFTDTENGVEKDKINYYFDANKKNIENKNYYTIEKTTIYDLLKNPFDKEDENMFYQVFKVANNFVNSKPDMSLYDFIYKNAKNKSVKYEKLITYKKKYNSILCKGKTSKFNDIKEKMVYKGLNYSIDIYIPNIKTANLSLKPIIAIGTDLYTNNDKLNDYIPAWYIFENGSNEQILINEKEALNSDKPVLILTIFEVDKNETIFEKNKERIKPNNNKSASDINISNVFLSNCKIAYRYERDNKSEYAFGYKVLSDDIGPVDIINDKFIKINKNDLNKVISVHKSLYPHILYAKRVYGVTYERDWYVSGNHSHTINSGGSPAWMWQISCKMKYANEWYQKVNYLDLNNSSFKDILSKGSVRFDWK